MDRERHATSATSRRAGTPRRILAAVGALFGLLCTGVLVTPATAQANSSPAPPTAAERKLAAAALIAKLDRLLVEKRTDEAEPVFQQLLASRATAVEAGLDLLLRAATTSDLTVRSVCALATEEVPDDMSRTVLEHVLSAPSVGDWTKWHCIRTLSDRVDPSFRGPLLRLATEGGRDLNLRIAALKLATGKWPVESKPTLVHLLQSAQEPIIHHKAQQYLADSGDPDAPALIEQFVLNRDPDTMGSTLNKEYGLLVLRFRRGEEVLPLLQSLLRDESWPGEIQERTIDLLVRSDLNGGPAILRDARDSVSSALRSRIDAALAEGR